MSTKIALAGNPNTGKTTLFNALTGTNQYVGNWPGVTVEKKEGKLKNQKDVTVTDLPGIYSLSPYTLEEVVARNYLIGERPDVILNIIDGTNLERNLYLTTQLMELGIPVVVAVNMMDVIRKNGDKLDTRKLSGTLGCPVYEISALKGTGIDEAAKGAVAAAGKEAAPPPHTFCGPVEHVLAHIEELALHDLPENQQRWYAVKLFERDSKVGEQLKLNSATLKHIEGDITACEAELDDDAESIITAERYNWIGKIIGSCYKRKNQGGLTVSDRIDRIVTNRFLALPIFAAVMILLYTIAMGTSPAALFDGSFREGEPWGIGIGSWGTDWANDVLFGEIVPGFFDSVLTAVGVAEGSWLYGLIQDGIVAGVGAVLGFVPQMLVLFFLLCILEDVGYMARIAFIMDRIFRRFGLSGKSFIPMLVATGCGVPGIMASRTIEQDRDRKMTVMTTAFMPCGAKLPIIGLIAGALFGNSPWIAASAYFLGMGSIIVSGIMLKKFKAFAGEPAPFVMELPAYHKPSAGNVLRGTWERGWSFIKRAGSVIVIASILIWFLQAFGFENGGFGLVDDNDFSLLAYVGKAFAWIFIPLGFGDWKPAVATIGGLVAKENVVGMFGILYHYAGELSENGDELWAMVAADYTALSAFSFMTFNLLCAPCFAAMGAIKREMNNTKWTLAAIGYMCLWAYVVALIIYQLGLLFTGGGFGIFTVVAIALLAGILYLVFRPYRESSTLAGSVRSVSRA